MKYPPILAIITLTFAATNVIADEPTEQEILEAQHLVESYQQLRQTCTSATGDARRLCLRELSQANPNYRLAKQILSTDDQKIVNRAYLAAVEQ